MSHRHLPAGQPMPGGGGGPGVPGGGDMGHTGYGGGYGGQGGYGGHRDSRRRQQPQHYMQNPYHAQGAHQMYNSYAMNPYQNQFYQQLPHQYQNAPYQNPGAIHNPYMHYQQQQQPQQPPYMRSPPAMQQQHYVPMAGVTVPQQQYPHQHQHSPALATPYQPPPIPAALPPQTPTSTHSSQFVADAALPISHSPALVQAEQMPPPPQPQAPATPQSSVQSAPRPYDDTPESFTVTSNFRAPLPWLSRPDLSFPKRRARKIKKNIIPDDNEPMTLPVSLPDQRPAGQTSVADTAAQDGAGTETSNIQKQDIVEEAPKAAAPEAVAAAPAPASVVSASAEESKRPTTSASNASGSEVSARPASSRPAVPAVPVIPAMPKSSPKTAKASPGVEAVPEAAAGSATPEQADAEAAKPVAKAPPSSWSALFSKAGGPAPKTQAGQNDGTSTEAEDAAADGSANATVSSLAPPSAVNGNSVAAALQAYHVGQPERVKYIKPRGLVNSGNMCYMNSILQVLIYCTPFYDFLDQVGQKASHSFKSQTPILDAMILFMQEFPVITSAESSAALRKVLKQEELVQYGDSFIPEFIYQAIEPEKRFENMRRGHQQDAQEFFGLLLQSLEDECSKVLGNSGANGSAAEEHDTSGADGWLEVGSKQKAAVTRSSGASSSTPINQIFGGLMRSELIVTGRQNSITTEPYQSLALDVGAPNVRNVVDAIKHLTYGEKLEGDDFDSNRGRNVSVTKQTLIDTLPPVLILHLKRFQFDATGGISKIWKKIGYPLELEIPQSALSKQWRVKQIPKYKLMAVVYHHGRQATGGHYTVDVRRQDDAEWIRIDDTSIRRVASQDVVEKEEAVKGGQQGSSSRDASINRFGAINDEDGGEQGEWTSVDKTNGNKNPWKGAVNGSGAQPKAKAPLKESVKDNKVAYLLFYQRV